jgi:hypothetical protein
MVSLSYIARPYLKKEKKKVKHGGSATKAEIGRLTQDQEGQGSRPAQAKS